MPDIDMADVRGQERARRALEIAAAGNHSLLLVGPPGAGKTMLARRLPTIMPPLTAAERDELAAVYTAAGFGPEPRVDRPFRAPHHTVSAAGMLGGGSPVRPGEVSLAHAGVLFLDELPEFRRSVLADVAGVLNVGHVSVYRKDERVVYPAAPLLVGATNACPCGRHGSAAQCSCSKEAKSSYLDRLGRIVGLLPFDMVVYLEPLKVDDVRTARAGESSAEVAARVAPARAVPSAGATPAARIAQTIARLAGAPEPTAEHEAEAAELAAWTYRLA